MLEKPADYRMALHIALIVLALSGIRKPLKTITIPFLKTTATGRFLINSTIHQTQLC